jgi:hypothetical protein
MEDLNVAHGHVAMQEAALGDERTGANERERGLEPILADAELSDEVGVQGEEVLEVAAPTVVGALAPGESAKLPKPVSSIA